MKSLSARYSWRLAAIVAVVLVIAPSLEGQGSIPRDLSQQQLFVLNSAIGGGVGGIIQKVRGGSFRDGLVRGALGGMAVYAGKRITVERWPAAGLAGRELAAIGTSVIRNAASGRPSLSRVMLPFGPLHFHINPDTATRLRIKLDFLTTAVTALSMASGGTELDLDASLSSGAIVIREKKSYLTVPSERSCVPAYTLGGLIMISDLMVSRSPNEPVFPHERVHVIQFDQFFSLVSDPAEERMAKTFPGGKAMKKYVDFNLLLPLTIIPVLMVPEYYERPWEREAMSMQNATSDQENSVSFCGAL